MNDTLWKQFKKWLTQEFCDHRYPTIIKNREGFTLGDCFCCNKKPNWFEIKTFKKEHARREKLYYSQKNNYEIDKKN